MFHSVPSEHFDAFRRLIEWCETQFELVGPDALPQIDATSRKHGDRMLLTFDDGIGDNFEAAKWLASRNIRALFFIVPSFLDRTQEQYLRFHEDNGVEAYPVGANLSTPGLATSQVLEMKTMGHEIGGHNFAHRDLGKLYCKEDLDYEIGRTTDQLQELLEAKPDTFAWGFGHPQHLSPAAASYLEARFSHVFSAVRGLNVVGLTPRFLLRDNVSFDHPTSFTRGCLLGAMDHVWRTREWMKLQERSGVLSTPVR